MRPTLFITIFAMTMSLHSQEAPAPLKTPLNSDGRCIHIPLKPFEARQYNQLVVRMSVTPVQKPDGLCDTFLRWGTVESPLYNLAHVIDDRKSIKLPVTADGRIHTYPFQLDDTPFWNGHVNELSFIPFDGKEATIHIDSFEFRKTAKPSPADIWDLDALKQPPKVTAWGPERTKTVKAPEGGERAIITRKVWYENVPLKGKPTRVMAFYSRPQGDGPFPAMVLVHGGGGTAFSDWTELWASRGYAAISMDHYGCEPDGEESSTVNRARHPLPDGSPQGSMPNIGNMDVKDTWAYHAVASIMKAHSLLCAQPQVDASRTGVTGMSWGGYLTSLVAGVDDRFKVALPFYGCGDLINCLFMSPLYSMGAENANRWRLYLDPVSFIDRAKCKILFCNNTDDFAYQLESHRATWQQSHDQDVWLEPGMPHSMPNAWRPEIYKYVEFVLNNGEPLPCLSPLRLEVNGKRYKLSADIKYGAHPVKARLWYTTDAGGFDPVKSGVDKWIRRKWSSVPATIENKQVWGFLPDNLNASTVRVFLDATGADNLTASTHYLLINCTPDKR